MNALPRALLRWLALVAVCVVALQLYFIGRVGLMAVIDPQSTTFQRSEAWRLVTERQKPAWSHQWVPYRNISDHLKRAVIASEDAGFIDHGGVEWDAVEKAWGRNQAAQARAEVRAASPAAPRPKPGDSKGIDRPPPKVVGGSTITQQLAKNLFLAGERNLLRKGQELIVTLALETLLPKQRILEIYLNNVEWGEGIFGAEAAAGHYFHTSAGNVGAMQAAQLAVMLPAPKRFEKRPGSAYVMGRAGTVAARMGAVALP